MKIATTTRDFLGATKDPIKRIEYIKQSGFSYVDYNFHDDYRDKNGVYAADWKECVKNIRAKCDDLGISLVQAHSPMGTPFASDGGEFLNATIRSIEICGELGIKEIAVHSGYLKGLSRKEMFQKNKDFYEKLFPFAEKYGVNILTENFNKMLYDDVFWIDNATDLLELIEYVNHPLFHAVWDTGHANLQEMSQESELEILGSHVRALHVHDNDGKEDMHMCPFFGTLDMDSLVRGLQKIGYDGVFTYEAFNFFNSSGAAEEKTLEFKLCTEQMLYKLGENIMLRYSI